MSRTAIILVGCHSSTLKMRAAIEQNLWSVVAVAILFGYLLLVQLFRYRRADDITSKYAFKKRPLSSMKTHEAFSIMRQLQQLEFPYAMNKARTVALLKVCHKSNYHILSAY